MSRQAFDEFLLKVTSRVKARGAHPMIKKELHSHLEELRDSYGKRGHPENEAEELAVEQMGNPYTVGDRLNRIHKPRMDWILIALFAMIAGAGLLTAFGAASHVSLPAYYFLERQVIWYTIALVFLVSVLFFDYRRLAKRHFLFYAAGLFLLVLTALFGVSVNGMQRWLAIGGLTIDGGMFALLFLFLAWAGIFSSIQTFRTWKWQLGLSAMLWVPVFIFISLPHVVLAIIYLLSVTGMFLFAGGYRSTFRKMAAGNLVFAVMGLAIIFITAPPYMLDRLSGFLDPAAYASDYGYIYVLVRDALSQAGWFGNGLLSTGHNIPEAHTDLAFAYLVYALGWVFGIFLCLLLLAFIWRISRNASKTPDHFGRLLVIGGATMFSVPAVWNIMMAFGLMPIAGVSLPFVSYGGSMLMFYAVILGLILNVYRRKDIVEPTMVSQK
ncbi:FtsW/RodA/SpoVE family cell cycle protein [Alteribacter natronophilus]|uniref:FtsW/RodA/SpoVE family cell cycle protein n=1 Tax=Alteribacter natronophilus TaxID=2583810 RepID=UPI00110E3F6F|nr:FtsW/RodA/SpoVE family cell cycle protein [Alteribacter natronophilus]TMW72828.1 FtsW/RodA/SpoVE family cell cycle protein [Alteribacter natronophilus]